MDLGLTDRVFVVTAATQGLGRAIAGVLVEEGARVVISARTDDDVKATARELGGSEHAVGVVAGMPTLPLPNGWSRQRRRGGGGSTEPLINVGGPLTASTDCFRDASIAHDPASSMRQLPMPLRPAENASRRSRCDATGGQRRSAGLRRFYCRRRRHTSPA